ncbi:MAG: class I SAM-dependent methyltransferase [Gemmatimonadaceae bacterium]|nr:class I SAM-dependent methyltransferase [Gemmatimonadaceae bacterium]
MDGLNEAVQAQIRDETTFWENDPFERPGADTVENLLNKSLDASIFQEIVEQFKAQFASARAIVEVGGGQGWASCIVKRLNPAAHVTLTDAVHAAVAGRTIWERVYRCSLDAAFAAPAQSIPLPDGTVDLVFCYAAAHHFVDHQAALRESWRVLRPGGWCLWLYEPTSSAFLRGVAEARVNRKRPDVKEHVLVPAEVLHVARGMGFVGQVTYWPHRLRRGRFESLYYLGLSFLPWLAPVLPCTAHFSLQRGNEPGRVGSGGNGAA